MPAYESPQNSSLQLISVKQLWQLTALFRSHKTEDYEDDPAREEHGQIGADPEGGE
jgi:hypothetical protein